MTKSTATTPLQPVTAGDRYFILDALRGLALLGVLLVNDVDLFRVSLFRQILVFHTHPGWANRVVDVLVAGLLEFKAFALFSLLFGVGIGIQTERLTVREAGPTRFLARRLAVLLGFGLLHMFLLSNVDILCLYAVCGFLLVPLLRCPVHLLAILGLGSVALTFILPFGAILPSAKTMHDYAIAAASVYAKGDFQQILIFRWHETWQCIVPLLLSVLPRTFGLMLLGIATWRVGILRNPVQFRTGLVIVTLVAGIIGGTATFLVVFKESCGRPAIDGLPQALVDAFASVPLAFAYAAAFLLWMMKRRSGALLQSVAALGQMALTNYLLQSVVLGFIFYSYGLGLFGRLGSAPALLIGACLYLAQLGFSWAWLRHYRFGPAEWLWRSLSYGRPQPMRYRHEALVLNP